MTARSAAWGAGLVLVLAVTAVFYLDTIPKGQAWGDDFAQYILHALNIAEGRAYADTGYIYNPHAPRVGPSAYPPLFPLMLAPLIAVYGPDIEVLKRLMVVVGLVLLVAVYWVARQRLAQGWALSLTALLGFSPLLWLLKHNILSDTPFTLMLMLTLGWLAWVEKGRRAEEKPWLSGLVGGLLVAACIGFRTVGVVLLPALLLFDLLRWRRLRRVSVLVLLIAALGLLAQALYLGIIGDYWRAVVASAVAPGAPAPEQAVPLTDVVRGLLAGLPGRVLKLGSSLSAAWTTNTHAPPWIDSLSLVLGVLAAIGFVKAVRRRLMVADLVFALYCGMLLMAPFGTDARRLLPIMPLFIIYAFLGLRSLPPRPGALLAGILLGAMLVSYIDSYRMVDFRRIEAGPHTPQARALFAFVHDAVPADAVVVFDKPRAMALYARRHAAPPHQADPAAFEAWMDSIGAHYLVYSILSADWLHHYVEAALPRLTVIYENSHFILFRRSPEGQVAEGRQGG